MATMRVRIWRKPLYLDILDMPKEECISVLRSKLQNQKWHCLKQYLTRMKEKISILAKCSVFMVMLFQMYLWYTYEYSHTDPLSHVRQNLTSKSSKNPPGNRSKTPLVPPDDIKSPKNLPAVKKKAVLLISRYRNQFIKIYLRDPRTNTSRIDRFRYADPGWTDIIVNCYQRR